MPEPPPAAIFDGMTQSHAETPPPSPEEPLVFGGASRPSRSWVKAMWRGARKRCPQCGKGKLFSGYSTTHDTCDHCGLDLSGHRADDAPPYFTTFIVGHVTIPGALFVERFYDPALWVQFAIWTPILIAMTAWLLPISKGALIGVQWANEMHGFSNRSEPNDAPISA